jgi:hypothetical protein
MKARPPKETGLRPEKLAPAWNLRRAPELIRALAKEASTRLGLLEAAPRIRVEAGDDAVGSFSVRGGHQNVGEELLAVASVPGTGLPLFGRSIRIPAPLPSPSLIEARFAVPTLCRPILQNFAIVGAKPMESPYAHHPYLGMDATRTRNK